MIEDLWREIEDLARTLNDELMPDGEFDATIRRLLEAARTIGVTIELVVESVENTREVARYKPEAARETTSQPERKSLDPDSGTVRAVAEYWRGAQAHVPADQVERTIGLFGSLIRLHWGQRNSVTLLPFIQDPGKANKLLRAVTNRASSASFVGVLHMDLDKFKEVNDKFGEPIGNAVIAEFGDRIRDYFSLSGIAVRTGGEEFSIVTFVSDLAPLLELAADFRSMMESEPFAHISRPNTCSIGMAIYRGLEETPVQNFDALMLDARGAERRAKADGRNRIRLGVTAPNEVVPKTSEAGLFRSSLRARKDTWLEAPRTLSRNSAAFAAILRKRLSKGTLDSANQLVSALRVEFGIALSSRQESESNAATVFIEDWIAAVVWSVLSCYFAASLTGNSTTSLSLRKIGKGSGDLILTATEHDKVAAQIVIAHVDSEECNVAVGAPWRPSPAEGWGVARWTSFPDDMDDPARGNVVSPCILLPIGDDAAAIARTIAPLAALVIEVDDRPVMGGGLPDFWQSNIGRLVRAALKNPNVAEILVMGAAENAAQTIRRLEEADVWNNEIADLQRRLSIEPKHLMEFVARDIKVVKVAATTDAALKEMVRASASLVVGGKLHESTEVKQISRRVLPIQTLPSNGLEITDGLRVKTLAEAYPSAIQLLRASELPPQVEPTGRRFREFTGFKLVLTDPFRESIPTYWLSERSTLDEYVKRVFQVDGALFAFGLHQKANGKNETPYEAALNATATALIESRPTRRILLPITSPPTSPDQPLGLSAIQIIPRARNGEWYLDFQWIWRTVEALVGFPFSAYGSITWSEAFFDRVVSELTTRGSALRVQRGELIYSAVSFHMFLDDGDLEIARAVVLDASG